MQINCELEIKFKMRAQTLKFNKEEEKLILLQENYLSHNKLVQIHS